VVRLATPGGDALASDLIWGELEQAREKKPVVISMSDICASGGYYIASASDYIFLQPTSVTGSIGVYAGKANLEGFYDKLGLSTAELKRGEHAGMFSLSSPFSVEERNILRKQLSDLYGRFIGLVADSRGLSKDSVDKISQGRVWSGRKALEIGLADEEGSILVAIAKAAQLAGVSNEEYQVLETSSGKLWPTVPQILAQALVSAVGADPPQSLQPAASLLDRAKSATPQLRLPYELSIE
jgi:protease-4